MTALRDAKNRGEAMPRPEASGRRLAGMRAGFVLMVNPLRELLERAVREIDPADRELAAAHDQLKQAELHLAAAVAILSGERVAVPPAVEPDGRERRRGRERRKGRRRRRREAQLAKEQAVSPQTSHHADGASSDSGDRGQVSPSAEPSRSATVPAGANHAGTRAGRGEHAADEMDGLQGRAQTGGLAEILGFVSSLHKSGTLVVRGGRENFLVELRDGAVIYAQGDNPPSGQLLGEVLVAQGALDKHALDSHLETSGNDLILGRVLLAAGVITYDELVLALTCQVQQVFHRICDESDALFQFEENVFKIETDDIRLNVQQLLLEAARCSDEGKNGPARAR